MTGAWNPWHGCHKISAGCAYCYMYYYDELHGKGQINSELVRKTKEFDLPLRKDRKGNYKIKSGEKLLVNMTSDTFLEEADEWRGEMWEIVKFRSDVIFEFITKRIERVPKCLPPDWGGGYENVMLKATCEDQAAADRRVPVLLDVPAKHRGIICAPMLGPIDLRRWLGTGKIEHLSCTGEHYAGGRPLDFAWVRDLCEQSKEYRVNFVFGEVGNHFIKDGKHYYIEDLRTQRQQAWKSGMSRHYRKIRYQLTEAPKQRSQTHIDMVGPIS